MYVFRDLQPEEPALSSGYLCHFSNLQIKAVMLDEVMATPDAPDKDMVLDFETKSLRDARDLITNVGLTEAFSFIEEHPHPRLYKLLAEVSKRNEAKRASLDEDENTRDESREIVTDIMATSTTKLTLFHSFLSTRLTRFALTSLKMHFASLGAGCPRGA